jgi:hypothetical protein
VSYDTSEWSPGRVCRRNASERRHLPGAGSGHARKMRRAISPRLATRTLSITSPSWRSSRYVADDAVALVRLDAAVLDEQIQMPEHLGQREVDLVVRQTRPEHG